METKTPPSNSTTTYHHQRAPRTPESYFNVPESIALLNIVKSERIQSAFQSNRKNHASVWEMVAEVLNRFSTRKRSAKQCCNRYENLKKIYTQLKKNPERHVRRNWPYMFLFKEIEEQRGECWGSTGKRLALIAKTHNELSYYHRRRQAAGDFGMLLNKEAATAAQHNLLQSLTAAHSTDSNSNNSKMERFLLNQFVEAQLSESGGGFDETPPPPPLTLPLNVMTTSTVPKEHEMPPFINSGHSLLEAAAAAAAAAATQSNGLTNGIDFKSTPPAIEYEKDCNGALNLQTNDSHIMMKSEPMSEGEFNPDDIQLMQTNYNGAQNFYAHHNIEPNILHPVVIVDTNSDCSSASLKSKRKLSTSTDGDSTNYELIEYLKRREKRDEELLKRMDAREDRLLGLLERTVVAIEALVNNKNKS